MISAILLAAGLSKRMDGENKLTKKINGIPLINYAIKNILGSAVDELIIVTGHEKEIIENLIKKNRKVRFVYNKNYKDGISTSIKIGVQNLSKKMDSFFICLGDMPNINQNIYNKLIKAKFNYNKKLNNNHKKEIFIPTFEKKNGNPILFSKYMKEKILNIRGDNGAKKLIELNKNKVLNVSVKSSGITLDFDNQKDFIPS